ncbi:methylmalonyl-CoA mutase small subunit [Rhodococcus sp. BGS-1C]|uniref:methylmalonyl-CoA mutase small subunit n=1 Tax=unclassified Rhodococcus (in: high G+C Gram-positive bacteria) TaxID=192944 RepID=UPI00095DB9D5|nr:methylmalonyl-CoA mutase small subunit [Rhodococcus sp. KRD197]OLT33395.1 methylmalonyl-CoA mutase small subunit [Rhodococcus sp. CUA-806]
MSVATQEDASRNAYTAWQKAVAGVLAKSRKVDIADLPEDPEHLLDFTTYDGVTVSPLYGVRDELPENPLPGAFPFVRGRDATRDVNAGWKVSVRFGAGSSDAESVNRSVLDGLDNGVSALWLQVASGGISVDDIGRTLDGVLFDLAPLVLDAGSDTVAAAHALFAVLDAATIADRSAVDIRLGATPLTSRFVDPEGDVPDLAAVATLARRSIDREEGIRAITVDGTAFHNAGASDAQEVGAAVAAGLEYLRTLTESGLTVGEALGQIEFRYAATDDQFQTIAKFRAARAAWARVADVCGEPDRGGAPQHAVTSEAMMAQRDPWVNMLRTTLAAFAAGIGGADAVTVLPFDAALEGGAAGVSKTFAGRIARNTQLLLLEESHLGRVLDPGSGSWYIEQLTEDIAGKAWEFVQLIEADGGYTSALKSGAIAAAIDEVESTRDADIAHRRLPLTGVNEFPNLAEAPLSAPGKSSSSVARYGAAFERLRDRSDAYLLRRDARPLVLLAPLGSVAEHNVRTTFAANLLASGGIEAQNPGPLTAETIADAVHSSGARIAVLCGTDKRYAEEARAAVQALREAGIDRVLLAGSGASFTDISGPERPDDFLTAKVDAVAVLTDLLDHLGA